jgi:alkylhydroperoxidase/carboxymuconolactone decarboxylase family protein YurZ
MNTNDLSNSVIFSIGEKFESENFNGTVWLNMLTPFGSALPIASVFGKIIDDMYAQSPDNQIHIQKYLSANCFGDYYTRKGLDIKMRELLTFSMLLSLGGCEPQLKGHIQGNVNVGNDKETLLSVVTQLLPYVGYPRTLNAIRCLNEVIPENHKQQ